MPLYQVQNNAIPDARDLNQFVQVLTGQGDAGPLSLFAPLGAPGAPTTALSAGSLSGAYQWAYWWITGLPGGGGLVHLTGYSPTGTPTASQNLSSQQATVTIGTVPTGAIGWGLARTLAGGSTLYRVFNVMIDQNGNLATQATDNTPDSELVVLAPTVNTTGTTFALAGRLGAPLEPGTDVAHDTAAGVGAVAASEVGAASGVASLDSSGHVPAAQLPAQPLATTSAAGAVELAVAPSAAPGAAVISNPSGATAQTVAGPLGGQVLSASGLAASVTHPTRWVGATTSGAPTDTGVSYAVGDWSIDQSGGIWICTGAGSPGTWMSQQPPPVGELWRFILGANMYRAWKTNNTTAQDPRSSVYSFVTTSNSGTIDDASIYLCPRATQATLAAFPWNSTAGDTAYAGLWDITAGALVANSTVSATSSGYYVSGGFPLTATHQYIATIWCNAGAAYAEYLAILPA